MADVELEALAAWLLPKLGVEEDGANAGGELELQEQRTARKRPKTEL